MTRYSLLLASLVLVGCGPKEAPVEAPVSTSRGPEIPSDSTSGKFAQRLLAVEISDWSPADTGEVGFKYKSLTFSSDNSWVAPGRVEIMDEYVDCEESGTWTMDPADSESTASMTWQLEKTSCPGREGGKEIRVKITIERDGSYEILMH